MTNWIASRMDDIEFEDAYIQQDELTMIPSWIRAFHDLEQNWEEFSAQRAEVEQVGGEVSEPVRAASAGQQPFLIASR